MKLSLNSSTDFNALAPLFGTPETVISSILDLSPFTSKTLLLLDTFSFFIQRVIAYFLAPCVIKSSYSPSLSKTPSHLFSPLISLGQNLFISIFKILDTFSNLLITCLLYSFIIFSS